MNKFLLVGKRIAVAFVLVVVFATAVPGLQQTAEAASTSTGNRLYQTSRRYLGRPYVFGATGPRYFDCSGFTRYVYRLYGIYLPRTAAAQSTRGSYVSKSNLRYGDLIFFRNTYKRGISHVGLYAGNNRIIHAFPKRGVTIDSLSNAYLRAKYAFSKRVLR